MPWDYEQPGPQGSQGAQGPQGPQGSNGGTDALITQVTQTSHGFTTGQAVYFDGALWKLADASDGNKLGLGIVHFTDVDHFDLYQAGYITGLAGLVAGQYYFVSDVTPGLLTATEPISPTSYSNPLLFAETTTTGLVLPFRPESLLGIPPAGVCVSNCAALTAYDMTLLPDGSTIFVQSVRDYFQLDLTSVAALKTAVTVATSSGTGRWLRLNIPSPTWATQTAWYIDPTGGNDENSGAIGNSLKTHGELARRWGRYGLIPGATDVYVLGNIPVGDPVEVQLTLGPSAYVTYHGHQNTFYTGVVTGVPAALNRATPSPTKVASAWVVANVLNKLIVLTSGGSNGSWCWGGYDAADAANGVFVTPWVSGLDSPSSQAVTLDAIPVAGDGIKAVNLSTVGYCTIDVVSADGEASVGQLAFADFDFGNATATTVSASGGTVVFFSRCAGDIRAQKGTVQTIGCKRSPATIVGDGGSSARTFSMADLLPTGTYTASNGSVLSIDYDTLGVGASVQTSSGAVLNIDAFGSFNFTTDAIVCKPMSSGYFTTVLSGTVVAYGKSASAVYGIRTMGSMYYDTKPTVYGTSGGVHTDTIVGGTVKLYAAIPYIEPTNNAMLVAAV